ncbi:hypothetical protein CR513_21118, partial [Mucuna pruriens]
MYKIIAKVMSNRLRMVLNKVILREIIGCLLVQRKFLWGEKEDERKVALVKWEMICFSKKAWELGIENLENFNRTLLEKWR